MTYETIRLTIADGIATITLNRPEVMNALNTRMRAELLDAVKAGEAGARVIVLTGEGRAFCSGQDLGDGVSATTLDMERVLREESEPLLKAIYESKVPTIAAVNGAAAGAGANLALAADVVIASDAAVFLQAFTRIGLIPDPGGTYWLPRQIGFARAMGAALFAETVSARQAADWGMIWECVPDAEFRDHIQARAAKLAAGPTFAYDSVKQALRASYANDLDAQLALEAKLQGACGKTRDFKEGVVAFLEKRPAIYEGR
jgi:2-(1,2-epoxy-1,2-dihydrophenyl)acetyl-CoA isomerase